MSVNSMRSPKRLCQHQFNKLKWFIMFQLYKIRHLELELDSMFDWLFGMERYIYFISSAPRTGAISFSVELL